MIMIIVISMIDMISMCVYVCVYIYIYIYIHISQIEIMRTDRAAPLGALN